MHSEAKNFFLVVFMTLLVSGCGGGSASEKEIDGASPSPTPAPTPTPAEEKYNIRGEVTLNGNLIKVNQNEDLSRAMIIINGINLGANPEEQAAHNPKWLNLVKNLAPKIARKSFASGSCSESSFSITFPTKISPGRTNVPIDTIPSSFKC